MDRRRYWSAEMAASVVPEGANVALDPKYKQGVGPLATHHATAIYAAAGTTNGHAAKLAATKKHVKAELMAIYDKPTWPPGSKGLRSLSPVDHRQPNLVKRAEVLKQAWLFLEDGMLPVFVAGSGAAAGPAPAQSIEATQKRARDQPQLHARGDGPPVGASVKRRKVLAPGEGQSPLC